MAKKTVDYISASQIGQFLFCPISYKYLYIDGLDRPEGNEYTAYGSAIHSALAYNYRQKIETKKDLNIDRIVAEFSKSFEKELNSLRYKIKPEIKDTLFITGGNVLTAYMEEVAPTIHPIEVELKFEIPLKHFPIKILGYIDLITEEGWIVDHKTVGKTFKRQWTQKTVNENLQLTFYSAAYRKLFGKKEKGVRIDLIPRQHKPEFMQIRSQRTNKQITEVLELATKIEKITELGVFVPNINSCSSCPFNKICNKQPIIPN